jgi:hypothetical protein
MRVNQLAKVLAVYGFLAVLSCGCGNVSAPLEETVATTAAVSIPMDLSATPTPALTIQATGAATATQRPSPAPDEWKSYPVVPSFTGRAAEIFRTGISQRRDYHAFSKIGDCQNITTYFLADFETPGKYRLGSYEDLQATIDWFQGSFSRKSLAVKGGLNVAAVMNPLMANREFCMPDESPLACELRVHHPSLALISFEEAWDGNVEKYETYMRQVIEYVISQGIVPIVATKADNLEGGDRINALIARLAWEYDIPLWNFWAAAQPLRSHGLTEDGFHLTQAADFHNFFFDMPSSQWSGWMARNLTALQVLDGVRQELISPVVS